MSPPSPLTRWSRSAWHAPREFIAVQIELHERMALLNRPWEEEFLHWAGEKGDQLHGSIVSPRGRRGRSTTSSGWCPGLARTFPGGSSVPGGHRVDGRPWTSSS